MRKEKMLGTYEQQLAKEAQVTHTQLMKLTFQKTGWVGVWSVIELHYVIFRCRNGQTWKWNIKRSLENCRTSCNLNCRTTWTSINKLQRWACSHVTLLTSKFPLGDQVQAEFSIFPLQKPDPVKGPVRKLQKEVSRLQEDVSERDILLSSIKDQLNKTYSELESQKVSNRMQAKSYAEEISR